MHYISRFLAGFAIGFSQVWQISLVTLAIVPLIAIAGGTYAYVTIGLMARVRKSYVKAGEIAEEVDCRLKFSRCVLVIDCGRVYVLTLP
jgi:ATP-binding cassette subfamily B (MDR/TAP) protein 1